MQTADNNPTQGLGIASLILGILSIIFAIIPCTIILALILSIIGLILGIIGFNKATQLRVDKGLLIAGIVTSVLGLSISGLWGLAFKQMFDQNKNFIEERYDYNAVVDTSLIIDFDTLVNESDKTMDELEKEMNNIESQEAAKPEKPNAK